ncbi:hypothetical protein BB558_001408 [Smittium angustum]|uniref:Nuclear condensin complex subunit 3 C-terminal domain-containing protein n=1 Tax=Smittium angustum TaxID=133377 RepID=A0A2U1JBN7_SMIAN|nr:hypothetical protein BB558_001408 [Smittium angustum]
MINGKKGNSVNIQNFYLFLGFPYLFLTAELQSSDLFTKRIFSAAQTSTAVHQRLAIELRKLQEGDRTDEGVGELEESETVFIKEFISKLNLALAVKKKEPSVERIVKFVVSFVHYSYNKETKIIEAQKKGKDKKDADDMFDVEPSNENNQSDDNDTVASRFTEALILHLLLGFLAKEKMVRLRCCQLVSMLVVLLKEIDEDLYDELIVCLEKRLFDKEAGVRANAAVALSRLLIGSQGESSKTVSKLLNLLKTEPNAEVRRAIILGLEINPITTPHLLGRARDEDTTNRRVLFEKVLPKLDYRILSIEKREELLSAGIRDRDPVVQQACIQMIASCWLKDAEYNLVSLFEGLDVVDSLVADDTIKALLNNFSEIAENIESSMNEEDLESRLPETLEVVKVLRNHLEKRTSSTENEDFTGDEDSDNIDAEVDYIILQLLMVAKMLDFFDELGRREMLTLMRKLLSIPDISENHIGHIMDIVRKLSLDEADFTQIVVEVISSVQQNGEEAQLLVSIEEKKAVSLLTQLKTLHIVKALLQRCYETLSEHSPVYALTQEYVSPALTQNEPALLKCAVDCLALCSLLDKKMASGNAGLLVAVCQQGSDEFRLNGLSALFDLTFIFGIDEISTNLEKDELASVFMGALENENPEIQAMAAEGLAKLLYGGRIPNAPLVLHNLAVLYLHIVSFENQKLRQCLSYFFPAYCYSSVSNQKEFSKAIVPIIVEYTTSFFLEWKGKVDVIFQTPGQVIQLLLSWADPRISFELTKNIHMRISMDKDELESYYGIGIDALSVANGYCDSIDENSNLGAIGAVLKSLIQLVGKLNFEALGDEDSLDRASTKVEIVYKKLLMHVIQLKQNVVHNFSSDLVLCRSVERLEISLLKALKLNKPGIDLKKVFEEFTKSQEVFLNTRVDEGIQITNTSALPENVGSDDLGEVDFDELDDFGSVLDDENSNQNIMDTDFLDESGITEPIDYASEQSAKLQSIADNISIANGKQTKKSRKSRKSIGLSGNKILPTGPIFRSDSDLDKVREQIDGILLED